MSLFFTNADSFITTHEAHCEPTTVALLLTKDAIRATIAEVVGPDYSMARYLTLAIAYDNLFAAGLRSIPF